MSDLDRFSQKIADLLREIIELKGVSQNQVAKLSGVSQPQISRILNKQRSVSVEDLHLIASALGVAASTIFEQAEKELLASSNLVQFPPKTLEDLGITDEDLLKRAAALKTTTPIHAEYDQHHWEE